MDGEDDYKIDSKDEGHGPVARQLGKEGTSARKTGMRTRCKVFHQSAYPYISEIVRLSRMVPKTWGNTAFQKDDSWKLAIAIFSMISIFRGDDKRSQK